MTVTDPCPDTIPGYRFELTCPLCGGPIREVQNVRQSAVSAIVIVECEAPRCGRQHDLTVRLTPIRKNG